MLSQTRTTQPKSTDAPIASPEHKSGGAFSVSAPDVHTIVPSDAHYPPSLARYLGAGAPAALRTLGNLDILSRTKLAIFCSSRCPGNVILRTYDLAQRLRTAQYAVISGFHAPVEQECLTVLLRGPAPVVICPARDIADMRLPVAWRAPLVERRLLVLSPFSGGERRPTADMAMLRNRFVAALADRIIIARAAPGDKTEAFCRELLAWGKPVYTLPDEVNGNLALMGVGIYQG